MTAERDDRSEPPPLFGSWRNLYALLVLVLAVLIALFYGLTRWAS